MLHHQGKTDENAKGYQRMRRHPKGICRVGGDWLEPDTRRRGRWRVGEFRGGTRFHISNSECRDKAQENKRDIGGEKAQAQQTNAHSGTDRNSHRRSDRQRHDTSSSGRGRSGSSGERAEKRGIGKDI
eukprot:16440724-Heterocapsa_arctica.AAC.1